MSKPDKGNGKTKGIRFVKWFRHYLSGKIIRAEDHGLKGFPLGR